MKKLAINLDSLKIDFSKVQQDQPGTWPLPLKALVFIAVVALVVFGANAFILNDKKADLTKAAEEEITLKEDFQKKALQAKNLDELRKQMVQATETLGALLKQLPSKTEVPGLLEDITKTGLGSGLEFSAIKMMPERKVQFYVELPISISVKGGYHDFATFVSGLSALSRIVTLHDFSITPISQKDGSLQMQITAKTYRADSVDTDVLNGLDSDSSSDKTAPTQPSSNGGKQ